MFAKIFRVISQVFVWTLILLLIGGLAIWGIGDILRAPSDSTVAKVGNTEITRSEIDFEVNKAKRNLATRQLPEEMMTEFTKYITQNVINQEINRALLQTKAETLGIEIDAKQIVKKDFLETGNYTREQLKSLFRQQGGEKYFLNKLVEEKKITFIESIFSSITLIDDETIKSLHKYKNQLRDLTILQIKTSDISKVEKPTSEELEAYYNNNKNQFLSTEHREITYILLDKSILSETDESLVADILYETTGELLDKLAEGMTLEESADAIGAKARKITSITASGKNHQGKKLENLPNIPSFIQTAFSTSEGETSDIIESSAGDEYAIIRVDSISPEKVIPLEDIKDKAEKSWKLERNLTDLLAKSEQIRKDIKSGKTIKQVSKTYNLELKNFTNVKRDSKDFPIGLIDEAFNLKRGDITNTVKDTNSNLIMAVINDINYPESHDPFELLETKDTLENEIFQEVLYQYIEYLKTKYKVEIN